MPAVSTVHQPKNILGDLLLLIKKVLSSDKLVPRRHKKLSFAAYQHIPYQ
jgi:hypothetical protein